MEATTFYVFIFPFFLTNSDGLHIALFLDQNFGKELNGGHVLSYSSLGLLVIISYATYTDGQLARYNQIVIS